MQRIVPQLNRAPALRRCDGENATGNSATNVGVPLARFRARDITGLPVFAHLFSPMCTVHGMARQTARFDLRIDPELLEAIERIATEKDRPIAWVVRDALRRYAQQEQEQEHGLTRP